MHKPYKSSEYDAMKMFDLLVSKIEDASCALSQSKSGLDEVAWKPQSQWLS
jgi:hypothetical protein